MLAFYFIFVIIVLFAIGYLVYKLPIRYPFLLVISLLVLITSPVVLSYIYMTYLATLDEVAVPNVTWMTIDNATKKLEEIGLRARIAERAYERSVPEGSVVSQRPEPGKKAKVGRVVSLKVSIGKRKVIVPNLVGRPFSQVEVVLEESGLKIGNQSEEDSEQYQTGVVCRQFPLPNVEIDMGSFVDVYIARNSNFGIVEMPNLVGKPVDEAKHILKSLKLIPIIFYNETKQILKGTVLSHEPSEFQSIEMGGRVKLFIATPPTGEAR
ncbi:MAG: PASTA domain-containing protein [Candidatus Saganbacteria bacterium]|nr:PASTA domain-containing protein [Candidatus Saganbacteria bacterium]